MKSRQVWQRDTFIRRKSDVVMDYVAERWCLEIKNTSISTNDHDDIASSVVGTCYNAKGATVVQQQQTRH